MVAFVLAGPLVSVPSAWWVVMLAMPVLLVYAPSFVRRQRRVLAGIALAGIFAVGLAAADGDFILAKPKECEGVTWTDADYWLYGCYAFGFAD